MPNDPEVAALVTQTRQVVGKAFRLSQDLQTTIVHLEDYVDRIEPFLTPHPALQDQEDDSVGP